MFWGILSRVSCCAIEKRLELHGDLKRWGQMVGRGKLMLWAISIASSFLAVTLYKCIKSSVTMHRKILVIMWIEALFLRSLVSRRKQCETNHQNTCGFKRIQPKSSCLRICHRQDWKCVGALCKSREKECKKHLLKSKSCISFNSPSGPIQSNWSAFKLRAHTGFVVKHWLP